MRNCRAAVPDDDVADAEEVGDLGGEFAFVRKAVARDAIIDPERGRRGQADDVRSAGKMGGRGRDRTAVQPRAQVRSDR